MRPSRLLLFALALLIPAAPASAAVPHTVQPGETLWSIAAANNLTTRTRRRLQRRVRGPPGRARLDGHGPDHGRGLRLAAAGRARARRPGAGRRARRRRRAPTPSAPATPSRASPSQAGVSMSSLAAANGLDPNAFLLTGTTLSLAGGGRARAGRRRAGGRTGAAGRLHRPRRRHAGRARRQTGVSTDAMAAMNGLDPNGVLLTGTVLKLPSGAPAPARREPAGARDAPSSRRPPPPRRPARLGGRRPERRRRARRLPLARRRDRLAGERLQQPMVSSANARGVMQVMPGTWDYVQQNLAVGRSSTRTRRPTTSTPA